MIDLLAAISSVDPPALLAWLVLAFAAGMFPVGVMLGSNCSPCCGCNGGSGTCETTGNCAGGCVCVDGRCVPACQPCLNCDPACLTMTFSGFDHGTDNCNECKFLDDTTFVLKRPATSPPSIVLSVSDPTGSGATLAGTLTIQGDNSYTVTKIAVTNGGGGYTNPTLTVSTTSGVQCKQVQATFTLKTTPPVQSFALTAPNGSGSLVGANGSWASITLEGGQQAFTITKLGSFNNGFPGTGYVVGDTATLDVRPSVERTAVAVEAATVSIDRVDRVQPSLSASVTSATGAGGVVYAFMQSGTDEDGNQVWFIGFTNAFSGSGYANGDKVAFTFPAVFTPPATVITQPVATVTVNGSGALTGLSLTEPGKFYASTGRPTAITLLTGGKYYKGGVLDTVTVTDGGEYWPSNSCSYKSDTVCAVCPEHAGQTLSAEFGVGGESNSFAVKLNGSVIASGTQSSIDDEDAPIPCDGFTFEAENVTGCMTNGTVTIASGECGDSSNSACEMPDQITLSLTGMGPVFTFFSRGGIQTLPGGWCTDGAGGVGASAGMGNVFCGECGPEDGLILRTGGTGSGIFGYALSLITQQDGSAVLDLVPGPCGGWLYQGALPVPPSVGWTVGYPANVSCNGEPGVPVQVSITPAGLQTTVGISAPTKGTELATATAEVTSVNGTGGITAVTLTDPGSGYAREIFTRTEPDIAVTLSASAGTGAVLAATLTQSGTGEDATWAVTSVAVTNGGTGYTGTESVVFTPEAGTTSIEPASAYVVTGRTTPTVTAAASGGSGASLSVTLTQSTDWNGLDVWGVSAVSVTSGGTGYTDGSAVTFTVTDGVTVYGASATITVGREEPTVTASVPAPSAGTGAVLAVTLTASGASWTVSGLSITNGGSGYSAGDSIALSTGDTEESGGYAIVGTVNGSGAITAVTIYSGGSYYRSTGVIESVSIGWGGEYFKSTGVIASVVVEYGGTYFISTPTGTVDADTPTVWFSSRTGTGANATAVVDTSLSSSTFGQITSISVGSGGTGYKLSGTGWLCTVSGVGDHLAIKDSNLPATTAVAGDPIPCTDFESRYTTISERVTTDPCPTSLLSKSYKFSLSFGTDPFAIMPADQEASDGMAFCSRRADFDSLYGYAHQHTFYDFGNGDIQCTLSPS